MTDTQRCCGAALNKYSAACVYFYFYFYFYFNFNFNFNFVTHCNMN